jgi:hypothetical protein
MNRMVLATCLIAMCSFVAGCHDSNELQDPQDPDFVRNYVGSYSRIDGYSDPDPLITSGSINLVVDGEHYRLEGSERYAPPGGCGRILIGDVTTFIDECVHTAEFDWSLVIDGDFSLDRDGSKLVLEQFDAEHDRLVRIEVEEVRTAR